MSPATAAFRPVRLMSLVISGDPLRDVRLTHPKNATRITGIHIQPKLVRKAQGCYCCANKTLPMQ
jgi:hypothetical protein